LKLFENQQTTRIVEHVIPATLESHSLVDTGPLLPLRHSGPAGAAPGLESMQGKYRLQSYRRFLFIKRRTDRRPPPTQQDLKHFPPPCWNNSFLVGAPVPSSVPSQIETATNFRMKSGSEWREGAGERNRMAGRMNFSISLGTCANETRSGIRGRIAGGPTVFFCVEALNSTSLSCHAYFRDQSIDAAANKYGFRE
jgi:hypothetical protein